MTRFSKLTIRNKVLVLMMVTSMGVLILSSVGFFVLELQSLREKTLKEHSVRASIAGQNCIYPLDFNQPEDALKILAGFEEVPSIQYAALYDENGLLFTEYRRSGLPKAFEPPAFKESGHEFKLNHFTIFQPIIEDGVARGVICLQSDLSVFYALLVRWFIVACVILALSGLVAYLFSSRLQRVVSEPIEALADITRRVSEDKNYDLKALKRGEDELGVLIDGFNSMMDQIQVRNSALIKAERKYRGIFENALEGIFQIGRNGVLMAANPSFAGILGFDSHEALTYEVTNLVEDGFFKEADINQLSRMIDAEGAVRDYETCVTDKSGAQIHIIVNAHKVTDENGALLYYEGTLRDITERKRVEELKTDKDAAEAATKAKSRFLANMSHEIRTPLSAISGLTNLALKTNPSAKQHEYLTMIQDSSQTLLGIINDILDFSKIEAGRLDLEMVDFHLSNVFEKLANLFGEKSAEKGIELILLIDAEVPCLLVGDALRLAQILMNLTSNAVKFTDSGEVLVNARLLAKDEEQTTILFQVKDTGIGIPADKLSTLFHSFSQADTHITRKYGGTGLGLSISKRLTEMMGGEISVESEPGKGAVFSVKMTFNRQKGTKEALLVSPDAIRGVRVLVVDRNEMAREVIKRVLFSFGFEADAADGGERALEMLWEAAEKEHGYQLAIINWKTEGMDGTVLVSRMKSEPKFAQIPSVLMVPLGHEAVLQRARELGVDRFLLKPVKQSQLFNSIMEVFHQEEAKVRQGQANDHEVMAALEKLAGARVLLVEDNSINRRVAAEILENAGIVVEQVGNGKDAVHAVAMFDYDAVLMDVQMPEMDGYEATRLIRGEERTSHLPIIAMTANAMAEELEKCLECGMNDFVTKPINPDTLFAKLADHLDVEERPASPFQVRTTKKELGPVPELVGFDVRAGLNRVGNKKKLFRELMRDFRNDFKRLPDRIRGAVLNGELDEARRLVHAVRGASGNISADHLYLTASELEEVMVKKGGQDLELLLNSFENVMAQTLESVKKVELWLAGDTRFQPDEGDPLREKPQNPNLMRENIHQLEHLLKDHDLEAETCLDMLMNHVNASKVSKEMSRLQTQVSELDFPGALETLAHVAEKLDISLKEGVS